MILYHGASLELVKKDIRNFKNGKFTIRVPNIQIEIRVNTFKQKKFPGSLGYGYYTYLDDKKLAMKYCQKSYKAEAKPTIIKIKVDKNFDDDHVLDFLEKDKKKKFLKFVEIVKVDEEAKKILSVFENNTRYVSKKQDVFAGIMTELFIEYLKNKNGKQIQMVRKETETFLPPLDNPKYRLGISNGVEVCIRDANCIKSMEM